MLGLVCSAVLLPVPPVRFQQVPFAALTGNRPDAQLPFLVTVPKGYELWVTGLNRDVIYFLHPDDAADLAVHSNILEWSFKWPLFRLTILDLISEEEISAHFAREVKRIELAPEEMRQYTKAFTQISYIEGIRRLPDFGVPAGMLFVNSQLGRVWQFEFYAPVNRRGDEGGIWRLFRDSFLQDVPNSELKKGSRLQARLLSPVFSDHPRYNKDRYKCLDLYYKLPAGQNPALNQEVTFERDLIKDLDQAKACRVLTFAKPVALEFNSGIFAAFDRYVEFVQPASNTTARRLGYFFQRRRLVHKYFYESNSLKEGYPKASLDDSLSHGLNDLDLQSQMNRILKVYYNQRGQKFQDYYPSDFP